MREEQNQEPIAFLWRWFLPMLLILIVALIILGFSRWTKIQQDNQRILENPAVPVVLPHQHHNMPYLENVVTQLTSPDEEDQVPEWMDEVKRKILDDDQKADDEHTHN